jgi:hypothetical protein
MLAIGFAFFGIWSAITGFSAFSRSSIFFDFCRAMQGIGPAICLPNAVAILGRSYPPGHRKNIAFAMFAACAPVSVFISVDVALMLATERIHGRRDICCPLSHPTLVAMGLLDPSYRPSHPDRPFLRCHSTRPHRSRFDPFLRQPRHGRCPARPNTGQLCVQPSAAGWMGYAVHLRTARCRAALPCRLLRGGRTRERSAHPSLHLVAERVCGPWGSIVWLGKVRFLRRLWLALTRAAASASGYSTSFASWKTFGTTPSCPWWRNLQVFASLL